MNPSGTQLELRHGDYSAVLTEVGATLRLLRHGERPLVVEFGADEIRPVYRGAVLAPWPNRVGAGRYTFAGQQYQLDITEPQRNTALHGLVAWVRWDVVEHGDGHAVLAHRLVPQPGYPHPLDLTVSYRLDGDGLRWSVAATNTGDQPAPYGTAPHPYLVAGAGHVDDWVLELPAAEYLDITADNLLPVGRAIAKGTAFDFTEPRRIGDVYLDHAYTELTVDADGTTQVVVRGADGHGVSCTWDPVNCPWVQIHTADRPGEAAHRVGLAVEPMTCPPDAFNSGIDLITLPPGGSHQAEWTISAI